MTQYQKLVRDRIPEIIRTQGETPLYRVLEEDEFRLRLEEKLDEEVAEYHKTPNLEELADILTVVLALAESMGASREELKTCYEKKLEERGGFCKRIFLQGKEG